MEKLTKILLIVGVSLSLILSVFSLGKNGDIGSITSPDFNTKWFAVNRDVEYHLVQNFADATTTIVSIANPFGSATSVVDMANLEITGVATSTFTVACGGATTQYAAPTYSLLSSGSIATSTGLGQIIENNLLTAYNGNSGGPDGGSVAKITLGGTYQYFNCTVTSVYPGAFTESTNTFAGKITLRLRRTR